MPSQFVIPEAILIGNPVCKLIKSWNADKEIRGMKTRVFKGISF